MSTQEIDPVPLSVKRSLGLIILSTALVLIPSIITSKRINVSVPKPSIVLGRLEPTAEAKSIQDLLVDEPVDTPPVVAPETAPEPPQAVVVPEPTVTPPPVIEEPVAPPVQPEPTPPAITGSKLDWLAASDIPRRDWELADWLIKRESSWNPSAQNPRSTAFGLKQFLDSTWAGVGCTKAEAINNPVYQLNCGQKYVMARYGSWANANAFWLKNKWY